MDESKAAKIAARAVDVAAEFFHVEDWTLRWRQTRLPKGKAALINTRPAYNAADIEYDITQMEDEEDLWAAMGHEIAHLVSAEFLMLHDVLKADKVMTKGRDETYTYALEKLTTRLEHLFRRQRPYKKWMKPKPRT